MSYTMYTPLNVWLDPASVTDVVAYIQKYLSENTIYSEEEIEELIHDYLIAHPELIGGVQSVNGKTGTVVLSASDINTQNNVTIESVLASLSSQISSIASSVATNTSNITNLKSALEKSFYSITNLVGGSFNANGNLTQRTDRLREENFINVKKGDKIVIDNGSLLHAVGAWDGTPSSSTIVRNDNSFSSSDETIVSELDDGYYIIVFKNSDGTTILPSDFNGSINVYSNDIYRNAVEIDKLSDDLDGLSDDLDGLSDEVNKAVTIVTKPVYTETNLINTTGAVSANGQTYTGGVYDSYQYSQKISVQAGDVVKPIGNEDGVYFRYLCAYNGNTVVSGSGGEAIYDYTVPDGIDGIVVTTQISKDVSKVSITRQTGTTKEYYPITQALGKFNWSGSLASGNTVELPLTNVRYNVVWAFTGHVTTMGKITLGIKSASGTVKELCSVDSTKVYYRLNNGTITNENHGLTISEDLQIRIESSFIVNKLKSITIYSGGVAFVVPSDTYGTDMNGAPYLASDGAAMTDCAFAWIPQDIDKPIWVFGDSWVSMYDSRWPYYMVEAGYTNAWMLNGFAGEDTDEAYDALVNLLAIRKPDYIVWLLGMNNGDTGGAVNTVWKNIYDKLIALCTEYKITPILYTVPSTPTIDNTYKNAVVTASGYRYIDGVAAVGDDGEGNWFTGFEQSESDHNHTSAKGARALFMRILTDFPEIASNSL